MKGTIKKMVVDKGFGFIKPDGGGKDIFFHCSALVNAEWDALEEGGLVEFETEEGKKGIRAFNITLVV